MDRETCMAKGLGMEEITRLQDMVLGNDRIVYLCDSGHVYEKDGVRLAIWGTPWTLANQFRKAFQKKTSYLIFLGPGRSS